jgi:hypothetical protein
MVSYWPEQCAANYCKDVPLEECNYNNKFTINCAVDNSTYPRTTCVPTCGSVLSPEACEGFGPRCTFQGGFCVPDDRDTPAPSGVPCAQYSVAECASHLECMVSYYPEHCTTNYCSLIPLTKCNYNNPGTINCALDNTTMPQGTQCVQTCSSVLTIAACNGMSSRCIFVNGMCSNRRRGNMTMPPITNIPATLHPNTGCRNQSIASCASNPQCMVTYWPEECNMNYCAVIPLSRCNYNNPGTINCAVDNVTSPAQCIPTCASVLTQEACQGMGSRCSFVRDRCVSIESVVPTDFSCAWYNISSCASHKECMVSYWPEECTDNYCEDIPLADCNYNNKNTINCAVDNSTNGTDMCVPTCASVLTPDACRGLGPRCYFDGSMCLRASETSNPSEGCSIIYNCSGHAFGAHRSGSNCTCSCRNFWQGQRCEICATHVGFDCNRCPPNSIQEGLQCVACDPMRHCSGHGLTAFTDSISSSTCLCVCRNHWSGDQCELCEWPYGGNDCEGCTLGLDNHPYCINKTQLSLDCQEHCLVDKECMKYDLQDTRGTIPTCMCTSCVDRPIQRVCTSDGLTQCLYPTSICLQREGVSICIMSFATPQTWVPCRPCLQ